MNDTLLLALGELIRKEISAGPLLRHLVDVMAQVLDADRGTIYILDEARQELVSVAAHLPEVPEIRVPLSQGIAGAVARTRQIIHVDEADSNANFWGAIDAVTGYRTRSMLVGPLVASNNRLLGVVQFLNKRSGNFHDADADKLELLTSQACRLLEQTTITLVTHAPREDSPPNAGPGAAPQLHLGEGINQIVGQGGPMREIIRAVHRVAPLEATVLLRGESGTGKGLIARALHHNSLRREGPFVQIDCTTLPDGLMESELFGHERGAFTSAFTRKTGLVEAADGGTLFLDEIGDLPLALQGKLLALLQDHTFVRVGGQERISANIRIVAATNRGLEELIAEGRFREDLYYRLKVVELTLPALRDRGREDLLQLIHFLVRRATRRHGRPPMDLRPDALQLLLDHYWPGNVRELENCLESAVIFADSAITPASISLPRPEEMRRLKTLAGSASVETSPYDDEPSLRELERRYIAHLLKKHGGNRSACARVLNIGRNTLLRKLAEHNLS